MQRKKLLWYKLVEHSSPQWRFLVSCWFTKITTANQWILFHLLFKTINKTYWTHNKNDFCGTTNVAKLASMNIHTFISSLDYCNSPASENHPCTNRTVHITPILSSLSGLRLDLIFLFPCIQPCIYSHLSSSDLLHPVIACRSWGLLIRASKLL